MLDTPRLHCTSSTSAVLIDEVNSPEQISISHPSSLEESQSKLTNRDQTLRCLSPHPHIALGESPRTSLFSPWGPEPAETRHHKSNFRGLLLPTSLSFIPRSPGCLHSPTPLLSGLALCGEGRTLVTMIRVRAFFLPALRLTGTCGLGEEAGSLCLGMDRGSIGGGWRLFVEFDSYAIALSSLTTPWLSGDGRLWENAGGNSMGLILEARSPNPFFQDLSFVSPSALLHTLLGSRHAGMASCWVKPARSIGSGHVHVMITNHRVKH